MRKYPRRFSKTELKKFGVLYYKDGLLSNVVD
jgi:hypothetical protein